jgi:hypothetical protein
MNPVRDNAVAPSVLPPAFHERQHSPLDMHRKCRPGIYNEAQICVDLQLAGQGLG